MKQERKRLKKTILATAAVIGVSTMLFQGLTMAATALEQNKVISVPTTYAQVENVKLPLPAKEHRELPQGYTKADYTVKNINLDYYRDKVPTSIDMSREDAAEIGAQSLWEIFGVNLEGQVIEMGYQPATDSLPRSNWHADVYIDGTLRYHFSVDSVTGDLFNIGQARKLNENVSVAYDPALAKNPEEYIALAKQLAEKFNVVNSAVQSVEYNSQGYSNNDPTISTDVKGENGEIALMVFSRHDKELLGIIYDGSYRPSMEAHEKFVQEMIEKIEARQKSAPPVDPNEPPVLRAVE